MNITNQGQTHANKLVEEARQLFSTGRVDESEAILQQVVSSNPREIQALVALGIVAAETGRVELAIQRMSQAVSVDSKCVPAFCWLSFLFQQSNQFEEARRYAERAIAIAPRHSAAHVALARAYVASGRHSEAIPSFQYAIALDPTNPVPIYEFADALLTLRQERDGMEVLRKAVILAPEPMALLKLGYLELRLGKIEDAEKYGRRALRKDPSLADAHVLLGRVLTELHRLDEAEEHWRQADALADKPGFGSLEKALSLAAIGQFDGALNGIKRSIEEKPCQGAAYQALVYSRRIVSEDLALVHQMEGLLSEVSLNDDERLNLLYSLGKSYDNLGDYEKAIDFFDRANLLKRQMLGSPNFDRVAFTASIDANIKLFTREFFAGWRRPGSESALPILIVGMMRSGTTLAEQMLSCHPQVGGAGEQRFWGENDASIVDYQQLKINPNALRTCANAYVDVLTSVAPGFPRVIDKNPANVLVAGSAHLAFPNARIIQTRRNAIDTVLSIWMTPMSTTAAFVADRANIVFAYKECRRLMDHWREVLPEDRFLEVQYEDLVSAPEVHAKRMVNLCGLEWNEACLHPELNQRRVRTPSFWQVRQPVYRTSIDRWKRYEPWLGPFEQLIGL